MLTDEQIADGWIAHDGGHCPVDALTPVRVLLRGGEASRSPCLAGYWQYYKDQWYHDNGPFDIIAYRLETPDDQ